MEASLDLSIVRVCDEGSYRFTDLRIIIDGDEFEFWRVEIGTIVDE